VDVKIDINTDTVETAKADKLLTVPPETSVREVFSLLQLQAAGSVLICREGKLCGIFTERDALRMMAKRDDLDVPIEQVMVRDPVSIRCQAPIADAIRRMAGGGYRRLPIVDKDGSVVGVVKVSGILHYFVDHFPETVFNLPPQPDVIMPEREGA